MHLFFFDQYISLDMLAPVIYKLSRNKKNKIFIFNFYKLKNFKKNLVYKFLLSNKNIIEIDGTKGVGNLLIILLLKILVYFLPKYFLKKLFSFWRYIWQNVNFLSRSEIIYQIKKNNIKTISYDESLFKTKRNFLVDIAKELKLKVIMNHGGLYTIKNKVENLNKFKACDYYLSPNIFPQKTYKFPKKFLKKNYLKLGSPRFDIEWIKKLDEIYQIRKKNNSKVKIAIFVRPSSISYDEMLNLITTLRKNKNYEVKLNYKPRDVFPTKVSNLDKSEMETSELIIWADIVLSYSTSIIFEIILRNKPLIFLKYLKSDKLINEESRLKNIKIVDAKNQNEVEKLLFDFKSRRNKNNFITSNKYKKQILNKFISTSDGRNILNKYSKFYNNI